MTFTAIEADDKVDVENHMAATALRFAHYNLCRVDQMLHLTTAMEDRLSDRMIAEAMITKYASP